MLPIAEFKIIRAKGVYSGRLAESQQLVDEFAQSIKKYLSRKTLRRFTSKNNIYRCTRMTFPKREKKFFVHEFSTKEFIKTARLLHPFNTNNYLKECFGKCARGTIQFVIFSSQSKAHAVCEVTRSEIV